MFLHAGQSWQRQIVLVRKAAATQVTTIALNQVHMLIPNPDTNIFLHVSVFCNEFWAKTNGIFLFVL
jgi:hypothetical protein